MKTGTRTKNFKLGFPAWVEKPGPARNFLITILNPGFRPGTRNPEAKTNPALNPEFKISDPEPGSPGRVAKLGINPAWRPSLFITPSFGRAVGL